ncbi:DUF4255 domain-containing protein [Thermomonospora amylolytica]|uniref:DUF4255 domain-containing protein n=1 Tax=Thermomonospora amylolytica TaxID=1411117 RepID=UPI000E6D41C2|nr:DUF4255 domain-containing protein [Thermomonospora amylolytica]
MSTSTALGSVSKSLRSLLLDQMTITPVIPVTLLAPDEVAEERRVNLFLYRVREHPQLRNLDHRLKPGTSDTLIAPPLSLILSYLMTAYVVNDPQTGNADAHSILGEAMRVFHQHPVVPEANLEDDLDEAREELRIVQVPLDIEEIGQLWSIFDKRFRLSVTYEVSVVQLDQSPAAERPLARRVRTVGVPEVRAPFTPPQVTGISPVSGPAGTVVTVHGAHLAGWRADATMTGTTVVTGLPLTEDSFTLTVPATLEPGFHRLRIDVSRLARATFFFEVT